jgi:hypothetical protein
MSCRRLIGLASFATHLPPHISNYHLLLDQNIYSSKVEAGLHGGVLWTLRASIGGWAREPAFLVNRKVFEPFCEQDRSMPAIPCEYEK